MDLSITGFHSEFIVSQTFCEQVTMYAVEECAGTLAFLAGLCRREGCAGIVVCCQAIIEAFPKVARPYGFDFTAADQMQTKHPSHCGMALRGYIVYKQSGFRSVQGSVVG